MSLKKWAEYKKEKYFCVLPFLHSATHTNGNQPLCCVSETRSEFNLNQSTIQDHWNSEKMKKTRLSLLKGEKLKDCRRCYMEESNNCRSHRMIENKAWEERLGENYLDQLISRVSSDGAMNPELMSVDLRLGNTCNLQCIMCQPRESSKWKGASSKLLTKVSDPKLFQEWRTKSLIQGSQFEWYKNESFWLDLKTKSKDIRELIIGGGEPLLIKEHLDFIKFCAESGEASHIHLRYHTNLTLLPEEMIPYWEKFEKVEFFASIDAMGERANYIRYPSDWVEIEKNLKKIDQMANNISLRVLFSVQALNIMDWFSFVEWVQEQNFNKQKMYDYLLGFICPGLVHWPEYLNIKILPLSYKKKIKEKWEKMKMSLPPQDFEKFDGVIDFMMSEDWSHKIPQTLDYIKALDNTRGTDFYSLYPDLAEVLLGGLVES